MGDRKNILKELNEISSLLASIPYTQVYTVYDGYFNGIKNEFDARLIADVLTKSNQLNDIPDGYFETLSLQIFDKIKASEANEISAELNEISPTLAAINNKNIYTVPPHYFDDLEFKNAVPVQAKVVKMNSGNAILKYAAAAVITGLLGLGIFNLTDIKKDTQTSNTTIEVASVLKEANTILQTNSFDKTFETLSDKEIEQYLTNSGEDVKAALVAASTDEADLPEAEDYMLDENTLDTYLKENNLNN